jgi:hypothetical protein
MPRAWITEARVTHNSRANYDDFGFAGRTVQSPAYAIDLHIVTNDAEFVEALWEYFHGEGVDGVPATTRRALPQPQHEIAPAPAPKALPTKTKRSREFGAAREEDGIKDAEFWNEGEDPE